MMCHSDQVTSPRGFQIFKRIDSFEEHNIRPYLNFDHVESEWQHYYWLYTTITNTP